MEDIPFNDIVERELREAAWTAATRIIIVPPGILLKLVLRPAVNENSIADEFKRRITCSARCTVCLFVDTQYLILVSAAMMAS